SNDDNNVVGTVEEEALTGGNEDAADALINDADVEADPVRGGVTDYTRTSAVATGDLQSLVSVGADADPDAGAGLAEFSMVGDAAALATTHNLTSAGVAVE
ncbi:hypothetical protein, partial [uncultured Roseibium sp.]|uniref:hypothetical protein n=1 Tax=uncultured Roseibium sp. TaxID=1936171 RepID=UPI002616B239